MTERANNDGKGQEPLLVPPRKSVKTLADILKLIEARHAQIAEALAPIISEVQADLDVLAGVTFPTFEEKRTLATAIQQLLNHLGDLRVECLKEDCHQPAILRCTTGKFSINGSFHFEHSTEGIKTRHLGPKALPHLKLTKPLPDRRLKKNEQNSDAHETRDS